MKGFILGVLLLTATQAQSAIHNRCLQKKSGRLNTVTHYFIPLLDKYSHFHCNKMEGTCIYKKNGEAWLHNYGYKDQLLSMARCKNGYGNMKNCLHPCRSVAASMKHHRFGQVLYIKDLVGRKCGNLARDGFEMIHDGYVVVNDTGSPKHFNKAGRLDFFWGRCRAHDNGICREGPLAFSEAATRGDYCVVWDPREPLVNTDFKVGFVAQVRREALNRNDVGAADDFDLDKTIGPAFAKKSRQGRSY